MSVSHAEKLYSEEEYLALERAAEYKSEFYEGRIYAMAGASNNHNVVSGNFFGELRNQLKGRPSQAYTSDMRVRVSESGLYTYPDVTAVCGDLVFLDDEEDTLLNPNVIVEVLSPTTERYDRGKKFELYRAIPSLQEILFVSQDHMAVDHYVRHADKWLLSVYDSPSDQIQLESVRAQVRVSDVYDRVKFSPIVRLPLSD